MFTSTLVQVEVASMSMSNLDLSGSTPIKS